VPLAVPSIGVEHELGQLGRAGTAVLGLAPPDEGVLLACAAVVAAALAVPLALRVRRARRG
jgi:hypothetical protein